MKVVSNSGPLINLAKVGQFSLLQNLFQNITIPLEVFEEVVARGVGQPGAGETSTAQWIVHGMLERSDIANLLTSGSMPLHVRQETFTMVRLLTGAKEKSGRCVA